MSLLGFAVRYGGLQRLVKPNNQGLPLLLLRQSPRPFSTEAEPPQDPSSTDSSPAEPSSAEPSPNDASPSTEASPADPFLQALNTGLTYGRLYGVSKYTLKTDIVKLLEGCNCTPQDVKVEYNRSYVPVNMMVQFPSWNAYDSAFRIITRKGRLYRLERADHSQWDSLKPHDGKFLLLEGIPRSAVQDDIERFLSGFEFDASSIQMFFRQAFPDSIRMAVVRFLSQTQAMNAALLKNRRFVLNNQVLVRVLQ